MKLRKKLISYLFEKVDITIIPSPKKKIKMFKMKRITPILIIIIVLGSITTLSFLYKHYQSGFFSVSDRLVQLKGVRAENEKLKNELFVLTQDTEELKENLSRLKEYNEEIKEMINIDRGTQAASDQQDLKLQTFLSYNQSVLQQGLPVGGGNIHLYYQAPDEIIARAKRNINTLKKELPTHEEDLNNLEMSVKEYNDLQAATPKIWPIADKGDAYISSRFGWRSDPFSGKQQIHEGLDIATWYNTPVLATADGVVKFVGRKGGYGLMVIIQHGFGFETRYAHLNKFKVKRGQKVSRGDIIALSGNSGKSSGPHVHYEVRKNNIPQNPENYIGR
ncbi:peptidoglycan DD-metalloendopeptidase family protein [Iocasia frigidifontis]|uniref:Peptidoglycan DD-metalloendopeptidase family protein n=1 Tax=Iocasia fonsfrigidae TaxID=2682810 RepID=A0A8A7KJ49_9FIRM|nr:M23 family metallopeptidase [Iocasia fonsfrigidae]QTL99858.1 peptidoglycan DD-metalloendopeptidase family protein [Iocasia fonsfrigidae]